ncbi:MAG: histidine phosphatase family protein, partial [Lachnospiraceae bacterium]|nr:histidine phosphatase family protein [Lachnospiraceae bacterium]
MEIYIVRHGETLWNRDKKLQGSTDIELSDYGRYLAIETGKNLSHVHFDRVFSSPLKRAYETACLIRPQQKNEIITDDRIRELNFGIYEG